MSVFLCGANFTALWFKGLCNRKALFYYFTWIFPAVSTGFDTPLFAAFDHMISAPVLRFASRTGNFFVRYDPVPISDLHPQFSCAVKLFIRFFIRMSHISWTGRTIIPTGSYFLLHSAPSYLFPRLFHTSKTNAKESSCAITTRTSIISSVPLSVTTCSRFVAIQLLKK